jgi:hypothetical protein
MRRPPPPGSSFPRLTPSCHSHTIDPDRNYWRSKQKAPLIAGQVPLPGVLAAGVY